MDQQEDVIVQAAGPIITVTFNRPGKLNALNQAMLKGLREATATFEASPDLRVLLVKANGAYFSAGADLHSNLIPSETQSPAAFRQQYRNGPGSLHSLGDAWEAIEKPIVVAHQGPCLGGAMELSLCADFRLASENASYSLPEIVLGGLPGSGGMSRLTRLAGPHWARWIALAGETVTAQEALWMGLVHRVTPQDAFDASVTAFCEKLLKLPPEAFAAGKTAIELVRDLDRASARNVERLAVSSLATGEELRVNMAAMRSRLKRDDKS